MKNITITGQWLNTLPLPHTRPYMVKRIFEESKNYHWTVRISGQHYE